LAVSSAVGVCSVMFALVLALYTTRIAKRSLFISKIFSLLPMVTPPFVVSLGVMLMFGRSGYVTQFLGQHFGVSPNWLYGFNGIEEYISKEDYDNHLSDLNEEKMKAEIERAEKEADITVVMPQMGIEYQLEPTEEQKELYHKMIDWGADIIFGGHPHVVEPAETVEKDGDKKLIIYSMGNFLSNQRIETMQDEENAKWTERGVLMDVTIKKKAGKTTIETAKAHPSWVNRTPKGTYSPEGYPLYLYQTYILDDFIEGGKYRSQLDDETKERIDTAYKEMNEHVGLKW